MTRPNDETGRQARRGHGRRGLRGSRRQRRTVVVAGLVVLAIAAIFVALSWTHAPWRDYVRRKPASYIELTVVRPQTLPSTFVPGQAVRFSFSINNVDVAGNHRTIGWVTSVRDTVTGLTDIVDRGRAVIEAGSAKTISEQVTIGGAHRTEVIVKLETGQQVDFYLSPPSTPSSG